MTTPASTSNATVVAAPAGHDAAMAAKFDSAQAAATPAQASTTPPAATPERPSWLPEKFASPEAMAQAYAELEKKQSAPAPKDQTPPGDTPPSDDAARSAVADAGLDYDALVSEFQANGNALKPETRADLVKRGIPEAMIDSYIAGQVALADQYTADLYASVEGGAEGYAKITEWAGKSLPAADVEAFNKVVDSGDLGQLKLAVAGLQSKFLAANGKEPTLLNGGQGDSTDVFASVAQVTAAMRDPRYAKDPAYRAEVQAKLDRSNVL